MPTGHECQLGRAPSGYNRHNRSNSDSLLLNNIRDKRTLPTSTTIQMNEYSTMHRRMGQKVLIQVFEAIYRNFLGGGQEMELKFPSLGRVGLVTPFQRVSHVLRVILWRDVADQSEPSKGI